MTGGPFASVCSSRQPPTAAAPRPVHLSTPSTRPRGGVVREGESGGVLSRLREKVGLPAGNSTGSSTGKQIRYFAESAIARQSSDPFRHQHESKQNGTPLSPHVSSTDRSGRHHRHRPPFWRERVNGTGCRPLDERLHHEGPRRGLTDPVGRPADKEGGPAVWGRPAVRLSDIFAVPASEGLGPTCQHRLSAGMMGPSAPCHRATSAVRGCERWRARVTPGTDGPPRRIRRLPHDR